MSLGTASPLTSEQPDVIPLNLEEQLGMDPSPLMVTTTTLLKDVVAQMSQSTTTCTLETPPEEAASNQRCNYALVMVDKTLLGIITERDLVQKTAEGVCFADMTALQIMSPSVVTLKSSTIKDVFTPLNLMRQYRIRHLPVLNDLDEVIGVITSNGLRQALPPTALLKRRTVAEVMISHVITASAHAPVIEVAQLMSSHRVSCVVIQESNAHPPQGIITEYDIVQVQRLELNLSTLTAEAVMSSPLECLHPEDQLWVVQQKMQQLHVRRLVVVNDQGHLVGLVTQTNVLSVLDPQEMTFTIEMLQQQVEQLQDERVQLLQERNASLETQMHTSESSLLVCKEKFRATFEQAAVGIAHVNLDGQFIAVNQRFFQILGYPGSDLLHKHFTELTYKDDKEVGLNDLKKLIAGEISSFAKEKRYYRSDGSVFWGNVTVSVAPRPSGQPDYLIVVLEDISNRKQAETALQQLNHELEERVSLSTLAFRASERRYRMLFELAPDMLFVLNMQGEIQKANAAAVSRLGYTETELLGRSLQHCFLAGSPETHQKDFETLIAQGTHRKEMEILCRDGQSLVVDCACSIITDTLDEPPHILVIQRDISTRILLENKLRSSEQQMRTVFEAMHDLVLICSMQEGSITDMELAPTTLQLNERGGVDLANKTLQFLWDHVEHTVGDTIKQVLLTKKAAQYEYSLEIHEHELFFTANVSPLAEQSVLWVARDITALKRIEKDLFEEKELAQVTLQSIGDAVITTDTEGNIYNFNPVAEQLTGWKTSETQGRPISEVFRIFHEETRKPAENPIQKALRENCVVGLANHTVLIAQDGTEYAIEDSAAPIQDRDGHIIGAVMVFHDVTHSRQLTRQLSWQASHDPLTRLPNRRKFDQILLNALQAAQEEGLHHVLCVLDLDQFKVINDTCGHAAGDKVLTQVAALLKNGIRATDTLARMGGDEFAILLYQCPLERAMNITEKLRQAIHSYRFQWEERTFSIGVCIGLSEINSHSTDPESLMGAADAACYAAKAKGRNRVQVYQEDDATVLQQRGEQHWSVRVKEALEHNLFCLYGQAIVPTVKGTTEKHFCEILLRLFSEQEGVISAGAFIPAAERYNLMMDVDRWVIRTFLQNYYPQLKTQHEEHRQPVLYMINLSGTSIGDETFLKELMRQFEHYPGAAQWICFEITETAAISNLSQAVHFIAELKKLGCSFALDDFGAGMSSFAYLETLPVDYLKIDGRFMGKLTDDPTTYAIVESINHIGHVMGLQTIAEFVSSETIRDKLQDIGVNFVQGYDIELPKALMS